MSYDSRLEPELPLADRLKDAAAQMNGTEQGALMADAAAKISALTEALQNVAGWECKGDALRDAYESCFGAGSWAALFED